MSPGARRAIGAFTIVAWLVAWVAAAAYVGDSIADAHPLVHLAFYAVAGVAWVIPLKPVFTWMKD
ncbi:MAG: DUF2842 domain-containing protein [Hyphomonadaceae bacterium]|nr:DUF2842 domain-containing protein [Hyphomonadaceae bacterium]